MLDMRRPDIVVGIDIGQTCSGVAYSIGPDWSDPKTINQWPSNDGMEKADKVATRVGYSKTRKTLRNWGFESVFGDETIEVREQFKLTLDPKYQDYRPYSCHDARQWYFDYLTCLHRQIENYFDTVIPRFRTMNVEYSFSTPTTWTNPAMIASLEKLIKKAGFAGTVNQTVRIALTEAEAAAIEASTTQYRKGDIFLICDAGGGTTDVNTLRVKSTDGKIELEPLDHVEGVSVGSTLIDFKMAEHIGGRLQLIKEHLDQDPIYLAEEMLAGKFQTVKHSFPNPPVEQFSLDVKGLAGSQSFPEAGIVNSKMIIDRSTLKDFFDEQITQIFQLIDERLMALETGFPDQQVSYVILSGGLGSSPYLYMEVKRRYEMNYGFKSNNTSLIRIMRVLEPQLAVVRGLVRERTQQLGLSTSIGQEVFKTRRCRNSYGIVVRAPYDETKHQGLQFFKDNLNRGRWVPNLVEWFVKEGEEIKVGEGIPRRYTSTLGEHDHHNTREAQIVMSSLPAGQLPQLTTDKGCEKVVMIKYQLTGNDMKLKNRQLWKVGKKYWKAEFIFVVNIGPADLRFNIVGKNGVLSSGHDKLDVEFMDPYQEQSSPKSQVATEFIRYG